MTVALTIAQVIERCTVTVACASADSLPTATIIVDGKAYTGLWTPGTLYTFTYDIALERGPHVIYGQATDSGGTGTTSAITLVMAYELTEYGIDIYSGDAKLDVIEPVLHDALLPDLPTLNFSCATLLTGTIQAVIRERGLRQYQFTIMDVKFANGMYQYICNAAETYVLTTAIMALQTSSGSTADALGVIAPFLNVINANLLAQPTYPQLFVNIAPVDIIDQLMVQALAQGSVRNGNLYVFPLDVSAQVPDYHMQRLDKLTTWERDADIYGAVVCHYLIKQYPTPNTVLTQDDAANWKDANGANVLVSDVTQVDTTLIPIPSGALGMLKSVGNASRAGLNAFFKDFDRVQFNWCPVTATSVLISLQQDASNKLEFTHVFNGQIGAGFVLNPYPTWTPVPTDTLTFDIVCSPVKYVTKVTGTMTARCQYRVKLLDAGGGTIWQDSQRWTTGNTFEADVPTTGTPIPSQTAATTVRIEVTSLYLVDGVNYGVQCISCYITVQTYGVVGSHVGVVSTTIHSVPVVYGPPYNGVFSVTDELPVGQWYQQFTSSCLWLTVSSSINGSTRYIFLYDDAIPWNSNIGPFNVSVYVTILTNVTDYGWTPSTYIWSNVFNLFEAVDLAFVNFTRTGNPVTLQTIAFTFTGDNYLDTLDLVADNPQPVIVQAGTGKPYVVTTNFGSLAGAQQYATGLLPIVSIPREQYTRDVPLSTDLGVGDPIYGDENIFTVYAVDYRQDGKMIAAGKAMDILQTRLQEVARRIDTLERQV